MNRFKKLIYILSWIPALTIGLVLAGLGLIVVPLGLQLSGGKQDQWPDIFWLWGNDEEWIPHWWLARCATGGEGRFAKQFPGFHWLAIRNPFNNHRFIFKDREANISGNWHTSKMEAQNLIDAGMTEAHRWAYNGMFAGYRRVWLNGPDKYSEVWIGWKVGSDVEGLGLTLQWRLKRDIGT